MPVKPILLIKHEVVETTGRATPALRDAGCDLLAIDAWIPGATWPELDDVSGVVMFGGAMNVDQVEQHPFLERERGLTREALDRGLPFLGICLGGQLLARTLGAPVVASPVREIGFNEVFPTEAAADDPLFSTLGAGQMLFHWHEDSFELPDGAVLLASGSQVEGQAFRVGDAAWGTQFHFEVNVDEVKGWLADDRGDLEADWGKSPETILKECEIYLAAQEAFADGVFGAFAERARVASQAG